MKNTSIQALSSLKSQLHHVYLFCVKTMHKTSTLYGLMRCFPTAFFKKPFDNVFLNLIVYLAYEVEVNAIFLIFSSELCLH